MRKTWMTTLGLMGLGLAIQTTDVRGDDTPGPIDSLQDLQDTGKIVFKVADTNNDGQISQKEAIDAGNLLVGGFFFRADANGDGAVSKEEAKAAKDALLAQKPLLRFILQKNEGAVNTAPGSPAANASKAVESIVDTNNDGQLQASELRQVVQTGVTALYASADTNRDGQMSPTEVNAAIIGMANAAAQAAFQAADTDNNGQISVAEFDKAIIEPAHAAFRTVDLNNDGQISAQEAQAARQQVMGQVQMLFVKEPANSAKNLIESGQKPAQVAPVPRFATPTAPQN